jgi:hypothetical protein
MLRILQGKREFYGREGFQAVQSFPSGKVKLQARGSFVAVTQSDAKCAMLGI